MKNIVIITLISILGFSKLSAQTRYYYASYNNIPAEILKKETYATATIDGQYGFCVGTTKFKSNNLMRGFSFSMNSLSTDVQREYWSNSSSQLEMGHGRIVFTKMSLVYEGIRLFGRKEIDDKGAFYGTTGYGIDYYQAKGEYISGPQLDQYDLDRLTNAKLENPIDISLRLGIGYQYMIGKQWMVFADGKGYLSLGSMGYMYNVGIRFRTLGN